MRKYLSNQLEPARLRATIVAALALATSLGIISQAGMPAWADGALVVFSVLWPIVQHLLVRPVVTPTAKVDKALIMAPISEDNFALLRGQLVGGQVPVE